MSGITASELPDATRDGQLSYAIFQLARAHRGHAAAMLRAREPAPHDRRVMVVSLTDAGRALQEPIADMWRTLEQISVRDLTPDQLDTFTTCVHTIEKSLRDHSRQAPAG